MSQRVIVIGAGIVGICSAIYLQRAGHQVTLVDRLPPGDSGASSYGNAGSISWSNCVPNAMPGLLWNVPRWLLDRRGPLTIRWRHLPQLAPWLWQFVRSGTLEKVQRSADALSYLHTPALELHRELSASAGAADLVRGCDYLHVYREASTQRLSSLDWRLRIERGARVELLDRDGLVEHEPMLSERYVQAVRIENQGYLADPSALVRAYADSFVANGGVIHQGSVEGFAFSDSRVVGVNTSGGPLSADDFVIAAGAWSRSLARGLGFDLPLETERGYHVMLPNSGVTLRNTVMDTHGKFVATPMSGGLRIAGTVELASVDAPPDYRRADVLLEGARELLPNLDGANATQWMGRRPSLPDGLPAIGPLPAHDNVFAAFGHAHTGMAGAPHTGRLICALVGREPINFDLAPFAPNRF
jgi:D-amino-acid dehydrogenase